MNDDTFLYENYNSLNFISRKDRNFFRVKETDGDRETNTHGRLEGHRHFDTVIRKVDQLSQGWPGGSLFNSYYTKV